MDKTRLRTEVRVECYAGYRSEETPRRFLVGKRGVEVVDVLDRWLSPEHRYFKLRGRDGRVYILRRGNSIAWSILTGRHPTDHRACSRPYQGR